MKVGVELIAIARRHGRRSLSLELDDGATPDDLLEVLDLPADEPYMTLVNGLSVAPGRRARPLRRDHAGPRLDRRGAGDGRLRPGLRARLA